MPKCSYCNTEIPRGKSFKGNKYTSLYFCSEEHYNLYAKIKSRPKPPVNYKPAPNTPRRKFTDYIQSWVGDINWAYIMKQAKDIQDEYEVDWQTMYRTLKYAHEYEDVEWKMEYGLYQFFPKYIKPMQDFTEAIMSAKQVEDIEDEVNYVRKPKHYIGKVEF